MRVLALLLMFAARRARHRPAGRRSGAEDRAGDRRFRRLGARRLSVGALPEPRRRADLGDGRGRPDRPLPRGQSRPPAHGHDRDRAHELPEAGPTDDPARHRRAQRRRHRRSLVAAASRPAQRRAAQRRFERAIRVRRLLAALALLLIAAPAAAQTADWAARLTEGDVALADFRFRSGETLPELRIHYATLGTPHRDARGADRQCGDGPARHRRLGPAIPRAAIRRRSSTAPASRSTSRAITSSCPTASAMAARPSRATACACASPLTIMTTWSRRSG